MRISAFALFTVLLISLAACRKDPLDTDPDARLLFSRDTIVFDTVFTTVGSATRQFKVYNTSSKAVLISSIRLAGGSASNFHLNIDGVPAVSTGDIVLRGGDSMYVFVDVDVDPNNAATPLMIEDSVLFETNGNHQRVVLNAVGQDAYFHYYATLGCGDVWNNDKPHVIYGYAIVPSCCDLTINAGARVHLHKNAFLAADSCASLKVLGAQGNPVTFQGDRLEPWYAEEPGQWGFIWLSSLSRDNVIDWAVIKNGTVGVLSDSLGATANPTVRITNTRIRNMSLAGIFGRDSWIEGDNVFVTNCAQYAVAIAYGGRCKFRHCTFANYWNIDTRSTPCVLLNNWYEVDDVTINRRNLDQADFQNCIIYGDLANELGLDSNVVTGIDFNYRFTDCVLKTNVNISAPQHFFNISLGDPKFHDVVNFDMHLDAGSAAADFGDVLVAAQVPDDLDGENRLINPDAGAFEDL